MYGSKSRLMMKIEHEVKLDRTESSMIRWMCGFTNEEQRKRLGLEPVSLVIKKGRLRCLDM